MKVKTLISILEEYDDEMGVSIRLRDGNEFITSEIALIDQIKGNVVILSENMFDDV